MQIQIDGLTFQAHSPSCYQLLSVRDDVGSGDTVHVVYNGAKWAIRYQQANGHTVTRIFNSRDAAIDLIAARIAS